jgi:hypothetical protein
MLRPGPSIFGSLMRNRLGIVNEPQPLQGGEIPEAQKRSFGKTYLRECLELQHEITPMLAGGNSPKAGIVPVWRLVTRAHQKYERGML